MQQSGNNVPLRREIINTLAQNGTSGNAKPAKILMGKGSDLSQKDYGRRKGKKKLITQALVLSMIDIAKAEGNKSMLKSLWNTYYCQDKVYSVDDRLYSNGFCKNRFCTSCMGIRKAEMINHYYPILKTWQDAHFVTLTVKSIPKCRLRTIFKKLIKGLELITDKYEKRESRGTGKKLIAIRSLECNFNPVKRTYNPHFHLIVPDKETAEILIKEWLSLWTKKQTGTTWVTRGAQHYRPIKDMEGALVEVLKYGSKIFTEPDGNEKKGKRSVKLYARAFYNIIVAMRGIRLFASYGIKLPKEQKKEKDPAKVTTDYNEWHYLPEYHDWLHAESEQTLFGYMPEDVLRELLAKIDNSSE